MPPERATMVDGGSPAGCASECARCCCIDDDDHVGIDELGKRRRAR
jgi:hypothetical protein